MGGKTLTDNIPKDLSNAKLTVVSKEIDSIGLIGDKVGHIQELNLSFNKITRLENIEQFKNIKYLDLSNNLVESLSDLRLLGILQKLEYLDLTNNPINEHLFFKEFLLIYNPGLKNLNRVLIRNTEREKAKKLDGFFRDIIESFRDNYLSILALKKILESQELTSELALSFQNKQQEDPARKIQIMKNRIISNFAENEILNHEALIIEDLESLAEDINTDNYVEAWKLACSEYATMQLEKHRQLYAQIQDLLNSYEIDEPRITVPIPEGSERGSSGPRKVNFNKMNEFVEFKVGSSTRKSSKEKSKIQDKVVKSAQKKRDSIHFQNCHQIHDHEKTVRKEFRSKPLLDRVNDLKKRRTNMEKLLKEKLDSISRLSGEKRIVLEELEQLNAVEDEMRSKQGERQRLLDEIEFKKTEVVKMDRLRQKFVVIDEELTKLDRERQLNELKLVQLEEKLLKLKNENLNEAEDNLYQFNQTQVLQYDWREYNQDEKAVFNLVEDKLAFVICKRDKKNVTQLFSNWKKFFYENRQQRALNEIQQRKKEERLKIEESKQQKDQEEYDSRINYLRKVFNGEIQEIPRNRQKIKNNIEERRLKRKAKYLRITVEELYKKKIWTAFLSIGYPNMYEKRQIIEKFRKAQIFNILKKEVLKAKINKAKADGFRKAWLTKKARGMIKGFKSEYLHKKQLDEYLKDYQNMKKAKFFGVWHSKYVQNIKEKQKVSFCKSRLTINKKQMVFSVLKENLEKRRDMKKGIKIALNIRHKLKLKKRLHQFYECSSFRIFEIKATKKRNFSLLSESFKALTINKNDRKTAKQFQEKIENFSSILKKNFTTYFFSIIKEEYKLKIVRDLRIKSLLERKKTTKLIKIFTLLKRNHLYCINDHLRIHQLKLEEDKSKSSTSQENYENIKIGYHELRKNNEDLKIQISETETFADSLELEIKQISDEIVIAHTLSIQSEREVQNLRFQTQEAKLGLESEINKLQDQKEMLKESLDSMYSRKAILIEHKNNKEVKFSEVQHKLNNLQRKNIHDTGIRAKEYNHLLKEVNELKIQNAVILDELRTIENQIEDSNLRIESFKNGLENIEAKAAINRLEVEKHFRNKDESATYLLAQAESAKYSAQKENKKAEIELLQERLYEQNNLRSVIKSQPNLKKKHVTFGPDATQLEYEPNNLLNTSEINTIESTDMDPVDLEQLQFELSQLKSRRNNTKDCILDRINNLEKDMDSLKLQRYR